MHFRRHTVGKILRIVFIIALLPRAVFAEQVIRTYSAHIELQHDGSVNIQEEIVYDFGAEFYHGIFRVIPLAIRALGKTEYTSVDISNIAVTDGKGNSLLSKYEKGGNIAKLTIGDANVTISGPQLYVIRYTLRGAVTPNLLTDQFDWDVLGTDWQAGIERTRAEIVFPKEVIIGKVPPRCAFVLDDGKTSECAGFAISAITTTLGYTLRYEASSTPPHTRFLIQAVFQKGGVVYGGIDSTNANTFSKAPMGGIVRWWSRPLIDFSLAIPFVVFFILLSLALGDTKTIVTTLHDRRRNYALAGIALFTISFFLPLYNLATLLSALVIWGFGFLQKTNK